MFSNTESSGHTREIVAKYLVKGYRYRIANAGGRGGIESAVEQEKRLLLVARLLYVVAHQMWYLHGRSDRYTINLDFPLVWDLTAVYFVDHVIIHGILLDGAHMSTYQSLLPRKVLIYPHPFGLQALRSCFFRDVIVLRQHSRSSTGSIVVDIFEADCNVIYDLLVQPNRRRWEFGIRGP
jgi:hypothetical protein